jgi:ferredoxin-type protein NapG
MADRSRYSRREMFLGRFLRGMAEGVADELHREVLERAEQDTGRAPTVTDDEASPAGATRQSAATSRATPDAAPTKEPAAPGAPAPSEEVDWNPPPRAGLYASRPDLPQAPAPTARNLPRIHRPPGALPEAEFLAGCTRKNDCALACPVEAIAPIQDGPAAGTPQIRASVTACISCEDTPCITACGPGVLTLSRGVKMGTAKIAPSACIAYRGVLCTSCVDRCPVPGAMELVHGRPRILADACTGCGVCHEVCPAPRNAVLLVPGID